MKRIALITVGAAVAVTPALVGVLGNASFAERLPVRAPSSATSSASPSATPSSSATSDDPASHDANDDHGGDRPRGGSDDPASHDANDDHGGDRDRSGGDSDHWAAARRARATARAATTRPTTPRVTAAATTAPGTTPATTTVGTRVGTDPTTEPHPATSPTGSAPVGDPARPDPPWVLVSDPTAQEDLPEPVHPRRVLIQMLLGIVAAMVLVGVLGALAASKLAEREAVNDAASMAGVLAEAVVQPAMTDALMAGDPEAVATFGATIGRSLDPETVVRVKLWRPDGYVLYADEPQLIGRTFTLDDDQREALDGPRTVAEISTLESSENQFEVGDRLVEVYRRCGCPTVAPPSSRSTSPTRRWPSAPASCGAGSPGSPRAAFSSSSSSSRRSCWP